MRILIVEDDEFTAEALAMVLSHQHYAVEVAKDGQAGWELVEAFPFDLILLDVTLPKLDGISLCQRLRSRGYQMPILLLTGRDSGHDKALGLDAGADDYVVKPFDQEELVARIRALLRRGNPSLPILQWGSLRLDPSAYEVTSGGKLLRLTPKEYALLELFLRNSRRVFSCGMILEHLWSYEETPGEEAVRTQIKGLRQKLKAAGAAADFIETVYGIGYRLKPLEEKTRQPASQPDEQQQTMAALAGVWQRFQPRINQQIEVLEQAVAALAEKPSQELCTAAETEAHNLAGSLGTFGKPKGSQLARKIEHLLQSQSEGRSETRRLQALVKALRQEVEQTSPRFYPPTLDQDERPRLLVVSGDRQLAQQLVNEANHQGIRAEVIASLAAAREVVFRQAHVVLLDLDLGASSSLALLTELGKRSPPVPVLVLTADDNLTTRLEVARLGGRFFLQKPIPPGQVLEAVKQVLQQADPVAARVMVMDDDPQILATLSNLLEPWGLRVIALDDPQQFWEVLEATSPDLLVLDIKMPHLNGIELCQVVRNDLRWSGLPVMFLTAHTDADTVNQVFAVGADDFVSKPIVGPELVTRIINRLERVKLLRSLAEIDPLTRVFNRQKSTQDLDKFLSLAKHSQQPLSLAVLDLDHLKQVNDHYGHAAGDGVLRQLGQLLWQSFRGKNVVARWGGEEFVVGMYGMTKGDGVQRLVQVLKILHQQDFLRLNSQGGIPDPQLQVTFSAGVAQYPEDGADLQSLYRSADTALHQAKVAGRDQKSSADLSVHIASTGTRKTELSPTKY